MPRSLVRSLAAGLATAFLSSTSPATASSPPTLVGPTRLFHTISEGLANAFSASQVKIDPGTYTECPTVTGLVLLTIVGKKGVVIDATGCDVGLTINDGEGVTVKGLTIVGAKTGISVKPGVERVLLTKTTISDPASDPQQATLTTGVLVQGATDVTLDGVTIRGAKTQAVKVASATGTTIRKSTLADGAGAGVVVDLGTTVTVAKNTITNLGSFGIVFSHLGGGGAADSFVQSNEIFATPGGIQVAGANNVVEKNKLTDLTGVGILASGPGGASTYRKNTLANVPDAAIIAGNVGDLFEKNTVKAPQGDGIDVIGDGNRFVGNKVSAAAGAGVLVEATASGNVFEGTSSAKVATDGFRVQGGGNTFTKAKASGSGGLDLNDPAGGATTNVYTDCKFKTSNVN